MDHQKTDSKTISKKQNKPFSRKAAAENEAQKEERRIRALISNLPVGIIVVNEETNITFAGPSVQDLLGYAEKDILNRTIFDFLYEKDHPKAIKRFKKLLTAKPDANTASQYRVWHKDGSLRWMEVVGVNLIYNETIKGIVLNFRDITDVKKREEREVFLDKAAVTLASSLNYKKVLRSIAALSTTFLSEWCIVYLIREDGEFERAAVAHREKDKQDAAKKLETSIPLPEHSRAVLKKISLSGKGIIGNDVFESIKKSPYSTKEYKEVLSELTTESIMLVPIKSRNATIGVICFARGKSGPAYVNEDLRFAEEFAQRIGFAIDNAMLYSNLEKNNKAKDVFLASLAHELRNPMAPIRSAVELMRAEAIEDPNMRDCVNIIDRQIQKTVHILDDLLDVSRITRGIFELHKGVANASKIAKHAIETGRIFIEQKDQNLDVTISDDELLIEAEALRVEQILVNLLDNASKYTPEGGNIKLVCEGEDDFAVFKVADDGQGIHPDFIPHVFDIFVQADKRLDKKVQGGLGIGLALVKELAELHGGTVEVHSDGVGNGSEFIVRIPLYNAKDKPHTGKEETSSIISTHQDPYKEDAPDASILVVDDNVDAAASLGKLLEKSGYSIDIAHDGASAFNIMSAKDHKIILLDIGLPGMSGYEIAKKIRSDKKNNGTLLVAITGYGQAEDKEKAKKAGFDYHITKPVSIFELKDIIEKQFTSRKN